MKRRFGRYLSTGSGVFGALALAFASASALAAGSGTIAMEGKTTQARDAYAYRHPASYDPAVTMTTIVVCDRAIDARKVGEGADRDKAVHDWLQQAKAVYWEAIFYPDGTLWTTNAVWPDVLTINAGGSAHNLTMTRNDVKRIEGAYLDPDQTNKDDFSADVDLAKIPTFDLKFAADVH